MSSTAPSQERRVTSRTRAAGLVSVWWLNPTVAIVGLVVPTLFGALWISDDHYRRSWRTPKWVTWETIELVLPATFSLALGCILGAALVRNGRSSNAGWPKLTPSAEAVLRRAFPILARLTFTAYGVWGLILLARGFTPIDLWNLARSGDFSDGATETRMESVAGVTTWVQAGVAVVTIGAILTVDQPSRKIRRSLIILFVLAGLRAYLMTERLALIELVIPWLVVRCAAWGGPRRSKRSRTIVRMAPLIALPLVVVVFALFELTRSWSFYSKQNDSYASFATDRFFGYYATSYNNGQSMFDHYRWPKKLPYYSLEFLWNFPLVHQYFPFEALTDASRPARDDLLTLYNNAEFNSPNGLISPAIDFGPVGGCAFLAAAGVAVGALHQSFRRGRVVGLLFYPTVFTGLLELPRELYWSLGRTTPIFVALLVVLAVVGRQARREAGAAMELPRSTEMSRA